MLRKLFTNKKGQGLVEYGLIIAGVALISAAAVSVFGHKTGDLISSVAAVLPGIHADDNAPIVNGSLIETTNTGLGEGGTGIALDVTGIANNAGTARLGTNVGLDTPADFGGLVLESGDGT